MGLINRPKDLRTNKLEYVVDELEGRPGQELRSEGPEHRGQHRHVGLIVSGGPGHGDLVRVLVERGTGFGDALPEGGERGGVIASLHKRVIS